MDLLGTTFAGYQVHRLIMRTALVSLYHAIWSGGPHPGHLGSSGNLSRPVSLWVSDPLGRQSTSVIDEFARRAELSAAIEHPALSAVLDIGHGGGRVFYVTPPTDARPLDEHISRNGPLSRDDAVSLLSGIADGLDVAHAAGLVHGAISPAMLWVERTSPTPRATLTGFGVDALLRLHAGGDQRDLLLDDVLYIAPEQLRGDDGVDGGADQYALACALHHCVTGRPPFVRDRTSALFGAHMLARPTPPASGSPAFDDAVVTGMAKDPDERFTSCIALLETAGERQIPRSAPVQRQAEADRPEPLTPPAPAEQGAPPEEDRTEDRTVEVAIRDALAAAHSRSTGDGGQDAATPGATTAVPDQRQQRTRQQIVWVAVALVVLGVVAGGSMLVSGVLNRDTPDEPVAARQPTQQPTQRPAVSTTAEVRSEEPSATVAWEREIGDEAVLHLRVEGLNAVAATGNDLTVVNPLTGSRRWRKVADVGVLNDLVTIGDVLVYRTEVLAGISLPYGIQLWESEELGVAPGGLTAGAAGVYTMAPGRILPEVASVDPRSGSERWHFHGHDIQVDSHAGLAAAGDGDVIVVLQRRTLFGLDPTHEPVITENPDGSPHAEITEERWREDIDNPWNQTVAATENEAVFALQNGDVCSHAVEDGARRWCVQVTDVRDGAPGLLIHDETVIVAAGDEIVALDLASGEERWQVEGSDPFLPLIARDGSTVTVADTEGTLHTYTVSDGLARWDVSGLGDITALVGADGGVIVGTEDGLLARVEPRSSTTRS
jgi:serine/threonine protein kinase